MSDINLHFSALELAIILAALYIVPITIGNALLAVWYFCSRSRLALVLLIIAAIPCAAGAYVRVSTAFSDWQSDRRSEAYVKAHTRTLARTERIYGSALPAGTVVEGDTSADSLEITTRVPVSIAGVPIVGQAEVKTNGLNADVTLARTSIIDGIACRAGYAKFEDGKVETCTLAKPQLVRGIPCIGSVTLVSVDASAGGVACSIGSAFRLRGVLVSAGTDYSFGTVTVRDANTTSVRVFGKPLSSAARVVFEPKTIDLYVTSLTIKTCDVDVISTAAGKARAIGFDIPHQRTCSLPLAPDVVRL